MILCDINLNLLLKSTLIIDYTIPTLSYIIIIKLSMFYILLFKQINECTVI